MGRVRVSRRRTSKNKQFKKQHATKSRRRDIDQIQDDLAKIQQTHVTLIDTSKEIVDQLKINCEYDEDLPGLGQHYCVPCGRHFSDENTLQIHQNTKDHKRRLKDLSQPQYTQTEAEFGARKTKEILPPAHPLKEI